MRSYKKFLRWWTKFSVNTYELLITTTGGGTFAVRPMRTAKDEIHTAKALQVSGSVQSKGDYINYEKRTTSTA